MIIDQPPARDFYSPTLQVHSTSVIKKHCK